MNELQKIIIDIMKIQHFDSIAVAVLDFSSKKFQSIEYCCKNFYIGPHDNDLLIFDLASITKPLTNGVVALKYPQYFLDNQQLKLLLNHRAGFPSGGRLSKRTWREDIFSYNISVTPPASTKYSDYSAIRLMLELEKCSGKSYKELLSDDQGFLGGNGIYFWKDLNDSLRAKTAPTGERNKKIIQGEVNDDNAFVIDEFLSHAGLFASADSLCKTLLYLNQKYNLLQVMRQEFSKINEQKQSERFILGWDRVEDLSKTLAGIGASEHTFGHLGFTGTSCWIDLKKNFGQVILTNATQKYSYSRENLNLLRQEIGKYLWSNGKSILN
ncbi:MAG: serine hydrolase [Oligoflexia bacterium]|nr:serine hydrolase [Oligoflexia bacterium]